MNKKFYLLGLCVAASATVANAQQLPNVGFEQWKDACGSSEAFGYSTGMRQRPGIEPMDWNGSSVNQHVLMTIEKELVTKTAGINGDDSAVRMENVFVSPSFLPSLGDEAPGYVTFGTPWVYAVTNIQDCDGGTYGGISFEKKPDAIQGYFRTTDSNEEKSHIIVYLWNGTFESKVGSKSAPSEVRQNVDRAILGKSNAGEIVGNGNLVASCDLEFKATSKWEPKIAELSYEENAGEPTMMNVIISAGNYWDRDGLNVGTALEADDVDFVYYSTLTALEVKGETVALEEGKYEYPMTGSELPTAEQVVAKAKSQFAEAAVTVDAENAQVRIVVTNQGGKDVDGETSHTYVLQYEKAAVEGTPYAGYLNIEMLSNQLAYNQAANIEIAETGEGVCTFILPDFQFGGQSLGSIVVENVTVTEGEDGVRTYNGSTPEGGDLVLVPGSITASASLTGTIDASGNCDFAINVLWIESNLPISVTFTTEMVGEDYEGYLNGTMLDQPIIVNENAFVTIAPTDVNVCTFILPDFQFQGISLGDIKVADVTVAEDGNGVKTYEGTAEGLGLDEGAITANVELNGTIDAENKVNFVIDVTWVGGFDGQTDVPINVTFTTNEIPAGVEGVSGDAVAVYGVAGAVAVSGCNGVVEVYAADGRLVKSVMVDGNAEISLNGGLYIVRAGSEAYKVFVK